MTTGPGKFFGVKAVRNFSPKFHKLQLKPDNTEIALTNLEAVEQTKVMMISLVHKQIFFEDLWVPSS